MLNTQTSPGASAPVKYQRDHHLRRLLRFDERVFTHHAKTNLNWLGHLVHVYTAAGQIILDPMAGSGSILLAALAGHPVISGDVETTWCELQRDNALRISAESLFCAPVHVTRWDAGHLPLRTHSIPVIITSPPYFDAFSDWNRNAGGQLSHNVGPAGDCYGFHHLQVANIHVYEMYLKAMVEVYREYKRILHPGGTLILILGDKVHKGQVVPVTADAETLCRATGFSLVGREDRQTIPSRYRHICRQRNPNYPLVETETALVFQKIDDQWPPARRISIIQAPSPDSAPCRQLFDKQIYWAERHCHRILILNGPGATKAYYRYILTLDYPAPAKPHIATGQQPNLIWHDVTAKARRRAEWGFEVVRELVGTDDVHAGDVVHLHVSHTYAPYLERRLKTIGVDVEIPTEHLNLGQKLAWYTFQNQKGDL